MKALILAILAVSFAAIPAQADQKIRAALLKRTEVAFPGGSSPEYSKIYGETASLERGTDTTNTEGYDFVCKLVAEENLQLTAYKPGTWDAVESITVNLHKGEAVLTLEKGRLLFSCYLTN